MFKKFKKTYHLGLKYEQDTFHLDALAKTKIEKSKKPSRTEVINFLLNSLANGDTYYLEIGVRNPDDNFNNIMASNKYSVDPGIEYKSNPVDFKCTSDEFFSLLKSGKILDTNIKFDVIFIDGLHLADQVERDIVNSLEYIKDNGFIVLHDCNPPTEFHSRESYYYRLSPAGGNWNGTTWKAFFKFRKEDYLYSCCVDTDWGVGILSKKVNVGKSTTISNEYYEFHILEKYRNESLNLIQFEDFKKILHAQ